VFACKKKEEEEEGEGEEYPMNKFIYV